MSRFWVTARMSMPERRCGAGSERQDEGRRREGAMANSRFQVITKSLRDDLDRSSPRFAWRPSSDDLIQRRTPLGLDIRAVTQNRDMAACLGLPTRRVDAPRLRAGWDSRPSRVALCPIYSVNPGMGSASSSTVSLFVVLGGVGSLLGTPCGGRRRRRPPTC